MKKTLLFLTFFLGAYFTVSAQQKGFRLGINAGLPFSDAKDFSSVNLGADANYLFDVADRVAIGASTGYSSFLGKDNFDDYSFVPVAFSGRVSHGTILFYGADVGYAIALKDGTDGGLFYKAKIGWTNNKIDAFIYYKGVSADENDLSCLGIGAAIKL